MKEFEMSEEDLENLLKMMKPTPLIMLQCGPPATQQEMANAAWAELGKKMGFQHMTVRPVPGKGTRFFQAEPVKEVPK